MTPPATLALSSAAVRAPFGGRPAYPDPRRPGQWRLCRTAWPWPGWQDDASGVPPACRGCGRSITPVAGRQLIGADAAGPVYAYVRAWRHLPTRRRMMIYGDGIAARALPLPGPAR